MGLKDAVLPYLKQAPLPAPSPTISSAPTTDSGSASAMELDADDSILAEAASEAVRRQLAIEIRTLKSTVQALEQGGLREEAQRMQAALEQKERRRAGLRPPAVRLQAATQAAAQADKLLEASEQQVLKKQEELGLAVKARDEARAKVAVAQRGLDEARSAVVAEDSAQAKGSDHALEVFTASLKAIGDLVRGGSGELLAKCTAVMQVALADTGRMQAEAEAAQRALAQGQLGGALGQGASALLPVAALLGLQAAGGQIPLSGQVVQDGSQNQDTKRKEAARSRSPLGRPDNSGGAAGQLQSRG